MAATEEAVVFWAEVRVTAEGMVARVAKAEGCLAVASKEAPPAMEAAALAPVEREESMAGEVVRQDLQREHRAVHWVEEVWVTAEVLGLAEVMDVAAVTAAADAWAEAILVATKAPEGFALVGRVEVAVV